MPEDIIEVVRGAIDDWNRRDWRRIEFFFDATEALEAAGLQGVAVPPKHVGGPAGDG